MPPSGRPVQKLHKLYDSYECQSCYDELTKMPADRVGLYCGEGQ